MNTSLKSLIVVGLLCISGYTINEYTNKLKQNYTNNINSKHNKLENDVENSTHTCDVFNYSRSLIDGKLFLKTRINDKDIFYSEDDNFYTYSKDKIILKSYNKDKISKKQNSELENILSNCKSKNITPKKSELFLM
jgi:hypothetical protein